MKIFEKSLAIVLAISGMALFNTDVPAQAAVPENQHALCWGDGWTDSERLDIRESQSEPNIGKLVPLLKQGRAQLMLGGETLKKLTAIEASTLGAGRGEHYLIAICMSDTPPVESQKAFEDWVAGSPVDYNIDPRYKRVLTLTGAMGEVGKERTIIYFTFPARGMELDTHEHLLMSAG